MNLTKIAATTIATLLFATSAMAGSSNCNCDTNTRKVIKKTTIQKVQKVHKVKIKTSGCSGGTTVTASRTISFGGNGCRFGSMRSEDVRWFGNEAPNGVYLANIQSKGKCENWGSVRVVVTDNAIRITSANAMCGYGEHSPRPY